MTCVTGDLLNVGSLELSSASKLAISPTVTGMFTLINYTGENGHCQILPLRMNTNVTAQFFPITSTPGVIQVNVLSLNPTSNFRWSRAWHGVGCQQPGLHQYEHRLPRQTLPRRQRDFR